VAKQVEAEADDQQQTRHDLAEEELFPKFKDN